MNGGQGFDSGNGRRGVTKAELARVLARAGYSVSTIDELLAQLQEPIVSPRNGPVFGRYGISPEALMDRLGGSP